jgi:hypothetical protein
VYKYAAAVSNIRGRSERYVKNSVDVVLSINLLVSLRILMMFEKIRYVVSDSSIVVDRLVHGQGCKLKSVEFSHVSDSL